MEPKGDLELYEVAVEIHKVAYAKPNMTKERYKIRLGHMLQSLFGYEVWTLKDLSTAQLKAVIALAEKKIGKKQYHDTL